MNPFVWILVILCTGMHLKLKLILDFINQYLVYSYCEQPGKCHCRFGWTGMHCDHCLTIPGCVHGFCNKPLECKCEEGWIGMFCSIRKILFKILFINLIYLLNIKFISQAKCKEGCDPTNGELSNTLISKSY